jgi:hypothetical protein
MTTLRRGLLLAAFGVMLAVLGAVDARAGAIYDINVNTTSLAGTSGYLDFVFNPGAAPVDPASVTLFGFTSDGTLTGPYLPDLGDVTGTLPGTVTINNTDVDNDHTEGFVFGSFFDIFVDLDIPAISDDAQSGDSFYLTLFDSGFLPLIGQGQPFGQLVEIDLDTNANPTVQNFSPDGEATVTATPEPASLVLLATGLGALFRKGTKTAARNLSN